MRSTALAVAAAAAMPPGVGVATSGAGARFPAEAGTSAAALAAITSAVAGTTVGRMAVAAKLSQHPTKAFPATLTEDVISRLRATASPIRARTPCAPDTLHGRATSPTQARFPRIRACRIEAWVLHRRRITTTTADVPGPGVTGTGLTGRIAGTTRVGPGTCRCSRAVMSRTGGEGCRPTTGTASTTPGVRPRAVTW